ncbi:hypothetical protein Hanom_Chr11g00981861 [Helianthus anomalus]
MHIYMLVFMLKTIYRVSFERSPCFDYDYKDCVGSDAKIWRTRIARIVHLPIFVGSLRPDLIWCLLSR